MRARRASHASPPRGLRSRLRASVPLRLWPRDHLCARARITLRGARCGVRGTPLQPHGDGPCRRRCRGIRDHGRRANPDGSGIPCLDDHAKVPKLRSHAVVTGNVIASAPIGATTARSAGGSRRPVWRWTQRQAAEERNLRRDQVPGVQRHRGFRDRREHGDQRHEIVLAGSGAGQDRWHRVHRPQHDGRPRTRSRSSPA